MPDTTPNLALPEIAAAQAQKHVTHNEALRALDALVHLAVLDRDLAAPPASPAEGQRWLVAAGASGAWSGKTNQIAAWQDGGWLFYAPSIGWLAYAIDEGALLAWSGTGWEPALDMVGGASELQNMARLGLGTTANATNPFSAKLNNTLWVAKTAAEGGDGDLRYKLSKESAAKTLSLLFQTNFSGRAEIGLTGDDNFHFKVSSDGTAWREAIVIDKSTGQVSFPQGGNSSDLELTLAELSLGVADALNVAQFIGSSGNRFADSFDALTYVDTAGATNLNTATAGLLKPSQSAPALITGGSVIGDQTLNGGLAATADGETSETFANSGYKAGTSAYSGRTLAAASKCGSSKYWPTNDLGFSGDAVGSVTIKLYGKTGAAPATMTDGTLLATVSGINKSSTAAVDLTSNDPNTLFGHLWHVIETQSSGNLFCAENQFFAPALANNLTVTSAALTAASAPSTARLVARVKEVDAITLNTDLVVSASRDGGATWSAFTLTNKHTSNTVSVYESGLLDISGQPSGTSMKWRIATANNKMVEIHAVYFYWA